jgi:myo-inositol-1(or 4)-monophosphatase
MQAMLNIAVKAARAGGAVITRASADLEAVKISRKAINDFVTETDHESEEAIIDVLSQAYAWLLGRGIRPCARQCEKRIHLDH